MLLVFALVLGLIGVLFYIAHRGLVSGSLGPNYFLGLRTPATTANRQIWRAAHQEASDAYSLIWKIAFLGAAGLAAIGFFLVGLDTQLWPVLLFVFFLVDVIVLYFVARSKADRYAKQLASQPAGGQ